ncbi:MAG: putative DNA base hypermodification protein, partial [Rhodospirillaceae bacterium]|nr:putative DNA base hypermodification protein [Rhodospirillaceae bacterium]
MNERGRRALVARRSQPRPSELYPTLWRFALERQLIYLRRLSGRATPWTDDWVLSTYRFTNAFRAADRVSQYLIRLAYADDEVNRETLFLRTVLSRSSTESIRGMKS